MLDQIPMDLAGDVARRALATLSVLLRTASTVNSQNRPTSEPDPGPAYLTRGDDVEETYDAYVDRLTR